MPGGRPTSYTPYLAMEICARLSRGESMRKVCDDEEMPAASTVYLWLSKFDEFSEQYARAKSDAADAMADDILYIADGDGDVQRDRLRVDSRKWIAAKLKPKKYGERLTHSGDEDEPIRHLAEIKIRVVDSDRPTEES